MCSPEGGGKKRHHEHGNATNGGLDTAGTVRQLPAPSLQAPASPRPTTLQAAA